MVTLNSLTFPLVYYSKEPTCLITRNTLNNFRYSFILTFLLYNINYQLQLHRFKTSQLIDLTTPPWLNLIDLRRVPGIPIAQQSGSCTDNSLWSEGKCRADALNSNGSQFDSDNRLLGAWSTKIVAYPLSVGQKPVQQVNDCQRAPSAARPFVCLLCFIAIVASGALNC